MFIVPLTQEQTGVTVQQHPVAQLSLSLSLLPLA